MTVSIQVELTLGVVLGIGDLGESIFRLVEGYGDHIIPQRVLRQQSCKPPIQLLVEVRHSPPSLFFFLNLFRSYFSALSPCDVSPTEESLVLYVECREPCLLETLLVKVRGFVRSEMTPASVLSPVVVSPHTPQGETLLACLLPEVAFGLVGEGNAAFFQRAEGPGETVGVSFRVRQSCESDLFSPLL